MSKIKEYVEKKKIEKELLIKYINKEISFQTLKDNEIVFIKAVKI